MRRAQSRIRRFFYSKKGKDTMAPVKSDTKSSNDSAKNALISQLKITEFSPMIANFLC
jgi:hypothetical protein